MRHIRYGLLKQAIENLNPSPILNMVGKLSLNGEELRLLYYDAWINKKFEVMEELFQKYIIQADFRFIRELAHELASSKSYQLLPLPHFPVEMEDFKSIVDRLTRGQATKGRIKIFGELTKKYGVVFLNNVHALNEIYPKAELNYDLVFNLDHERVLLPSIYENINQDFSVIRNSYSLKRIFNLLVSAREGHVIDVARMLSTLPAPSHIAEHLPRKPKNFIELHDCISLITMTKKKVNYQLKQDVHYLQGMLLLDYLIEVPKESFDLVATSHELKHCVHGYDQAIIKKEVQIINLVSDHKRRYTIELVPSGNTYAVKQFKGLQNNPIMEGPAGTPYIKELKKLLRPRRIE